MATADHHDKLRVCFIELHGCDKLRIVDFPSNLLSAFRDLVPTFWPKGIQRERTLESNVKCFELKVNGNPWSDYSNWRTSGGEQTSHFLLGIMRFMHDQGWGIKISMATMSMADHDTLFFERLKQIPATQAVMCCLAFSVNDKIRITDGHPEVIQAVEQTIQRHWQKGLSEQSFHASTSTHEIKLGGNPWSSTFIGRYTVDSLVTHLMLALQDAGWTVYATVSLRFPAAAAGVKSQVINRWILKKDHDNDRSVGVHLN